MTMRNDLGTSFKEIARQLVTSEIVQSFPTRSTGQGGPRHASLTFLFPKTAVESTRYLVGLLPSEASSLDFLEGEN